MSGEVNLFGVFVPGLLLLAIAAALLTAIAARLLALANVYRLFAYRPAVDVALFVILLGLLAFAFGPPGVSS